MLPRRFSSEGFVLSRKNYSEADRILVVYSETYGKLSLLAKGVRKPKSRKRGSLEIFSQIKFAASKGKSLSIVTEAETINNFNTIRKNLKKVSVAYFYMETVDRLTRSEERSVEVYNFLIDSLKSLEASNKLRSIRKEFTTEILTTLGFWPAGQRLADPDTFLESIVEREMVTKRVGKRVLE